MAAILRGALLLPALLVPPALRAQEPAQPGSYVYLGTVHAVRPTADSLVILTGVGHALRHIAMVVPKGTPLEGAGIGLTLADLRPGDVVRVACHRTATGLVADRVERLDRTEVGGP
jgi:hypothetical protein